MAVQHKKTVQRTKQNTHEDLLLHSRSTTVIQALASFQLTSCTVSNSALQLGWKLELFSFKNWKIIKIKQQLFRHKE
jgi:hypothetical protein